MFQLKEYGVQPPYEANQHSWNLKHFKRTFSVEVHSSSATEMEFDLVNVDCALANTLRRILLVEVPSMAIEKVFIYQNTSMIQDEVLAHRLGLIPLDVDPQAFNHLSSACPTTDQLDQLNENECLLFDLSVRCSKDAAPKNESGSNDKRAWRSVYAHELRWVALGDQGERFQARPPQPVRGNGEDRGILVAKLAPGQEISLRCLAVKGIGKDHAKFSPVATAFYRMHPRISLTREVTGELAKRLKHCFPKGVIEVDDDTERARVANERLEVRNSREALRDAELAELVELGLDSRHFIFSVESTGAMSPASIVEQALRILITKCDVIDIALASVGE